MHEESMGVGIGKLQSARSNVLDCVGEINPKTALLRCSAAGAVIRKLLAVLNRLREGCRWRALSHDFPPWDTV